MKIAIGIEYNGANYFGWQAQTNLPTVQTALQTALTKIADEPIEIFCAGRTDAGVHSTGQVAHFNTTAIRPMKAWVLGTNSYLPSTVSIQWAQEVDEEFHARFSAQARRYRYIILNQSERSALLAERATWFYRPLNLEAMQKAARFLFGELDFTSFRASSCQARSPMRNVQEISLFRHENLFVMDIQANAFLHHMVRNIAGVLMQIGAGLQKPEWMQEVLAAKDRRHAAQTASPHGLYLTKVVYPEIFNIPQKNPLPLII